MLSRLTTVKYVPVVRLGGGINKEEEVSLFSAVKGLGISGTPQM